jgi:hypothetical protein
MTVTSIRRRLAAVALAAAAWLTAAPAPAQWYVDNQAATPAESYARGMSSVISAQGDYNLKTAAAAVVGTEAVSRDIDNRAKWTNTYFEMRKMNRQYTAEERGKRPTSEDLVRYAQAGKPKRLSPSELDFISGKISWPKALQQSSYDAQRKQLEELFHNRATYGGTSFEQQGEIRKTTNDMLASLKEQIQAMPSSDYLASKRFLESLAYEAQLPTT